MKRRDFIGIIGGASVWPIMARAQQPLPVIGVLTSYSPDATGQTTVALLVNPASPEISEPEQERIEVAARTRGLKLHVARASDERGIDAAFVTTLQLQAGALIISPDAFFSDMSAQLGLLSRFCDRRRPDELLRKPYRLLSNRRPLHRPHPEWRKAFRLAGPTVDQARHVHQPYMGIFCQGVFTRGLSFSDRQFPCSI
jgi:hypothetical protein